MLADSGDEYGVDDIVEGLHHHGEHNGQAHGDQKRADRFHSHLVLAHRIRDAVLHESNLPPSVLVPQPHEQAPPEYEGADLCARVELYGEWYDEIRVEHTECERFCDKERYFLRVVCLVSDGEILPDSEFQILIVERKQICTIYG